MDSAWTLCDRWHWEPLIALKLQQILSSLNAFKSTGSSSLLSTHNWILYPRPFGRTFAISDWKNIFLELTKGRLCEVNPSSFQQANFSLSATVLPVHCQEIHTGSLGDWPLWFESRIGFHSLRMGNFSWAATHQEGQLQLEFLLGCCRHTMANATVTTIFVQLEPNTMCGQDAAICEAVSVLWYKKC